MKKILFFAISALSVLACTKEEPAAVVEEQPITFTASIDEDESKTTISEEGKVDWVIGDEITVSDGTNTGVYSVTAVGDHRTATFTYKRGTEFTAATSYTAVYANVNDQWYNSGNKASNCPMYAPETEVTPGSKTIDLKFKNSCGIVAITANTGSLKIAKIVLGSSSLNFADPIVLNGTYFIAVPAGESLSTITFVKEDCSKASKTFTTPFSVAANHLKALKMNTETTKFFQTATSYTGYDYIALPGVFSVSATEKVHFSKGNLWSYYKGTTSEWYFENNQYDARSSGGCPIWLNGSYSSTGTPSYNFGQFKSVSSNTTCSDYYGRLIDSNIYGSGSELACEDWGTAIDNLKTWRTLTSDQMIYLMRTRSTTSGKRFVKAKITIVSDIKGVILFPDNYSGTVPASGIATDFNAENTDDPDYPSTSMTKADWEQMEQDGCVFLPACGYSGGSFNSNAIYWTKTINGNECYCLQFNCQNYYPYYLRIDLGQNRKYRSSVRLVTFVK